MEDIDRWLGDTPRALDGLVVTSGQQLNAEYAAKLTGAQNLLQKAFVAAATDLEKADRLIERAAAMPYDEREESFPGVQGAVQMLYEAITDDMEDADEDDHEWLGAALAAHEMTTGPGKAEVASILNGMVLQTAFFALPEVEKRRITKAVGSAPLHVEHLEPDATVTARAEVIRSVLAALAAYLAS